MNGPPLKLRIAALVCIVAIAVTIAACGDDESSDGDTASAGSGSLTKVTMVQEWPVADGFWIPWILGKQEGFYEDVGIDLEIVAPPTVADTMKYLGTGRADVAFTTIMDVLFAREQGAEVTSIGRYSSGNNWGIMSSEGEPLTPAELEGKTIGIYNDAWTKEQLSMVLQSAGLSLSDVKTVSAADDTVPLLLRDKVDAITGLTTAEGSEIVSQGEEYEFLQATDHGVPNSPILLFAANDQWLAENPDLGKKFMKATDRSVQYAIDNPEEGVDAYFEAYGDAYDRGFVTQQWGDTIALFEKGPEGSYFVMDDQMWTPLITAVKDNAVVETTFPASDYYTNELVED